MLLGGVFFLWATRTLMRNLVVVNAHLWGAAVPRMKQKHILITTLVFAGACIALIGFARTGEPTGSRHPRWLPGHVPAECDRNGCRVVRPLPAAAGSPPGLARPRSWLSRIRAGLSILRIVSRVYLPARFEKSSQLYGSLGVAAVMLAWLLIIGNLIVASALINVVWSDYRAGRRELRSPIAAGSPLIPIG